jgi:anti-sigma regulatory factor (Ser/Thr protein kinase)
VVREAITNAARHARATEVLVVVTAQGNSTIVLESQPRSVPPIRVRVDNQKATLHPGHTDRFALDASDPSNITPYAT